MIEVYKCVASIMEAMEKRYAAIEYKGPVDYPYFVGQYEATTESAESGTGTGTFFIDGWGRDGIRILMEDVEDIAAALWDVCEIVDGVAVKINTSAQSIVPTEEAGLYRMQVRADVITVKEG